MTENEQNDDKALKKFNAALTKLVAIVGGKENLRLPKKTPNDQLGSLVEDLFQEERETVLTETKNKLKEVLKSYAELEKALSNKRKELEKLEKDKKAEFVKSVEGLFGQIENVADVEKTYYTALQVASENNETL